MNVNTPEYASWQYNSMVKEKLIADPVPDQPEFPQVFPSSELTRIHIGRSSTQEPLFTCDVPTGLAMVEGRQAHCQDRKLTVTPHGVLHLRAHEGRDGRRRRAGIRPW